MLRFSCSCPRWGYTPYALIGTGKYLNESSRCAAHARACASLRAPPAALRSRGTAPRCTEEARVLAVQWRRRAVTRRSSALCCARAVPSCRPLRVRMRVGYVRAARRAPLQLQVAGWRVRSAPLALRGCCLRRCGLSVSAALRTRWPVADFPAQPIPAST